MEKIMKNNNGAENLKKLNDFYNEKENNYLEEIELLNYFNLIDLTRVIS